MSQTIPLQAGTPAELVAQVLPARLHRLRQISELPVVFGGAVEPANRRGTLVISRLVGTIGTALDGLAIGSGHGLGGAVLTSRTTRRASDYASDTTITHEYDHAVMTERLRSVIAAPIIVGGEVRGVIYGATRQDLPLGDRVARAVDIVADQTAHEVESRIQTTSTSDPSMRPAAEALADLARLIDSVSNPHLRRRLTRIHGDLDRSRPAVPHAPTNLTPRELDTLRLVGVGATNLAIAGELGLGPETVKSYLASAMRKLGAANRTEAAHLARTAGLLEHT